MNNQREGQGRSTPRMRARGSAYEPVVGFQSTKAAQIAAYFVAKAGGKIDKLKLAKLGYLAEREHVRQYDAPMIYDELYSLPHGPICSGLLNGIDGKLQGRSEWKRVQSHGRDKVHGSGNLSRDQFQDLSDAELSVLESTWTAFGSMTAAQVRNHTHVQENCPEYTDVSRGRLAINYRVLALALGKSEATAAAISNDVDSYRLLEVAFNR